MNVSWRYLLPLALLAAPPILGVGQTVRAGFVLDVTGCAEVVPVRGHKIDLDGSKCSDIVVTKRSQSGSRENEPMRPQQGAPSGGGDRPAPFRPTKQVPHDYDACQSMGGASNNLGAGASVYAASLPSVPVVFGPDLAMRFFAREGQLRVEGRGGRLFRPPRIMRLRFCAHANEDL